MKQIVLTLGIALITSIGFSQKSKLVTAAMAYGDFMEAMGNQDLEGAVKEIQLAKENIDQALAHEDTKDDAKCLMYAGKIYISTTLTYAQDSTAFPGLDVEKTTEAGFGYLTKSKEVDTKERYVDDVNAYANNFRVNLSNQGISAYGDQKYDLAMAGLLGAAKFGEIIGLVDTVFYFFGGQAAIMEKEYDAAAQAFKKCIDANYSIGESAGFLSEALSKQGKTEEAEKELKTLVEKHPKNLDLLIQVTNFYINEEKPEGAEKTLAAAIALDPSNIALVYTSGVIYETMGRLDDAEAAYKKTLELDPANNDAKYSLGVFYFNKGADKNNEANALEFGDPSYDTMIAESKVYFEKALPFLEEASAGAPDDVLMLESLKAAYGKLSMTDKFMEVKAKIAALKK